MTTPIDADGYQRLTIKEGNAPFLVTKVTNKLGTILQAASVATIKATITNITTAGTVLNESTLTEGTVWFDTYQTATDADGDTLTYNFGWQTLASYFKTAGFDEDSQFKVEVWVTMESGEPCDAGWWLITAKRSIVPIAS